MWAKLLTYFKLRRIKVTNVKVLSIGPSEFLVVAVESGINTDLLRQFQLRAREFFKSENVLVISGDDIRLLKVAIEDRLVDEMMLKEEVTKWKN